MSEWVRNGRNVQIVGRSGGSREHPARWSICLVSQRCLFSGRWKHPALGKTKDFHEDQEERLLTLLKLRIGSGASISQTREVGTRRREKARNSSL